MCLHETSVLLYRSGREGASGEGFSSEKQIDDVVTDLVADRSLVFRDLYFSQNESSQRLLSAIAEEGGNLAVMAVTVVGTPLGCWSGICGIICP